MKKAFIFLWIVSSLLLLSQCERNHSENEKAPLSLVKTTKGGCNNGIEKIAADSQNDTVIFTVCNDTLNVFAGINYICCTPFTSAVEFRDDSLIISLNDICPDLDDCYCKCMCYYTWDFVLTGFEHTEYHYKITLNGNMAETNPKCIRKGTVSL